MSKLRALGDRIIVKRQQSEDKSPGGIIIPDAAKQKVARGEVLAVGPGKRDEKGTLVEPCVKVGEVVVFGNYSGSEIKVDGEELLVVREDDLLGVVEG